MALNIIVFLKRKNKFEVKINMKILFKTHKKSLHHYQNICDPFHPPMQRAQNVQNLLFDLTTPTPPVHVQQNMHNLKFRPSVSC